MNLEFNELVEHEIQLIKTEMIKANCECQGKLSKEKKTSTDIRIKVSTEIIDGKSGYSYINVLFKNIEEGFYFDITQRGLFEAKNDISNKKDVFENFLAIQGVRIMWSYVRESLYDLSCRMIGKPYMLPTLDVIKTLANAEEGNKE